MATSSITGTSGNDTLNGTSDNDTISGLGGNDTIDGQAGSDGLDGGDGNDFLNSGGGRDFLDGGPGDDTLLGGDGDDALWGREGNDSMDGGDGNDSFDGGPGNDTMRGGAGDDSFGAWSDGGGSDVVVYAGRRADYSISTDISGMMTVVDIRPGSPEGTDKINQAIEKLRFSDQDITINVLGLELTGSSGPDTLVGGDGSDGLSGGNGNDFLNGGANRDFLDGGPGDDTMLGGSGEDALWGREGNDTMDGGDGNDSFDGGPGNDTMRGGAGDDSFGAWSDGGGDDVVVYAGRRADYSITTDISGMVTVVDLRPGSPEGTDKVNQAIEKLRFSDQDITINALGVELTGSSGPDTLVGGDGSDGLSGGNGNDFLNAGANRDFLDGGAGDDTMLGGAGDDALWGREGNDSMDGGDGNDSFDGGPGNDSILGGTGIDSAGYSGTSSNFSIVRLSGQTTVTDLTGAEGIDVLTGIEYLSFAGQSINLNNAPTGSVTINGNAVQGQTLAATNSLADLDGIPTSGAGAIAYQWLADGVAIGGATGAAFTLTAAQAGHAVSVKASYTDLFGTAESKTSASVTVAASDTTPPTVTAFSPADEATGVAVGANIVLTFNEAIQLGTGSIVIKTAAGTTVATYDAATSTNLSISGNTLTINPTADLATSMGYRVEFAPGTMKDLAGNSYAGAADYNFTTARTLPGDGRVVLPLESGMVNSPGSLKYLPNGKIVLAGVQNAKFVVQQLNGDGTPDMAFGQAGRVDIETGAAYIGGGALAYQADGKLLVAGSGDTSKLNWYDRVIVTRLNADGSLDSSYGGTGQLILQVAERDVAFDVIVQADGKAVVAGHSYRSGGYDFTALRLNIDGSLDNTFGTAGKAVLDLGSTEDHGFAVTQQPDGKLVLCGHVKVGGQWQYALARLNVDGSADGAFGSGGKVLLDVGAGSDQAYRVLTQPDGKLLVAGASGDGAGSDFCVIRLNANGTLDTSFGSAGKALVPVGYGGDLVSGTDQCFSLKLMADGRMLLAGYSLWGGDGGATIGRQDLSVVRLLANGMIDTSFGSGGKVIIAGRQVDGGIVSLDLQPDGHVLIAGTGTATAGDPRSSLNIVRLNPDGTLDTSFENAEPSRNSLNGHYYQYVPTGPGTPSAALTQAETYSYRGLQGYLVTISSSQENDFLAGVLRYSTSRFNNVLSGTDQQIEGTWVYQSGPEKGSVMTYLPWSPGEPNGYFGGFKEDYLVTGSPETTVPLLWADVPNMQWDGLTGFVVEFGGLTPSYMITPSVTALNEGGSVTFTIDTTNIEWGTTLSYQLSGISQDDLASGGLTGTVTVGPRGADGRATLTVQLATDQMTEGAEMLTLTAGAASATVSIVDISVNNDTTAPTLTSSTPADNASAVQADANVTLTFSEAIKAGTGNLVLTNTANAADTRTVSVSDASQVSISGSTLTLNPTADMLGGAHYTLTLGSGVVQDLAGNTFAGISSPAALDFWVANVQITGTSGNDFLTGTSGNDFISGLGGNDVLRGGPGNDALNGGQQFYLSWRYFRATTDYDTADYSDVTTGGIRLNLSNMTVTGINGADVGTDTLRGVESVQGTRQSDIVIGSLAALGGTNEAAGDQHDIDLYLYGGSDTVIEPLIVNMPWVGGGYLGYGWSTTAINAVFTGYSGTVSYGAAGIQLAGADYVERMVILGDTRYDDRIDFSGLTSSYAVGSKWNRVLLSLGNDTVVGNGETAINFLNNVQSTNGSGVYVKLGAPGTTFTVNMTHLSQNGTALGVATLSGINNLRGTILADTMIGGAYDFESFRGRGGNDYIDGGNGDDRSEYVNGTAGITANLAAGSVVGDASVGIDTLRSMERIRGTDFDDTYDARGFSGSSLNAGSLGEFNAFEGMGGNDTIYGNGSTLLDYFSSSIAVEVNLASGVARARLETERTGELAQVIGQDTFTGVSAVRGSALADLLIGGGLGRLEGGNRVESFEPGGGNDTVNGADGFDSVTYLGNRANYLVTIGSTNVTVTDMVGYEGTDTLTGVEQLVFADLTVSLTTAPPTDTTAPTLNSSTPADNANAVLAGTNLTLTFNEAIKAGTGNLVLANTANATDTRTVSVSDASQVSISGSTLTLNPTADLLGGAHYALTLGSGVVQDLTGNSFAGISSATTLDFSVELFDATITGTSGNDVLTGTSGNDSISGLGGNDALIGGPGNDYLNGGVQTSLGSRWLFPGADYDWADYSSVTTGGIRLNLSDMTVAGINGANVGFDTLRGIEAVWGTRQSDVVTGSLAAIGGKSEAAGDQHSITLSLNGGSDTVIQPLIINMPWVSGTNLSYGWSATGINAVFTGYGATVSYGASGSQSAGTDVLERVTYLSDSPFDDRFDFSGQTSGIWAVSMLRKTSTVSLSSGNDTVIGNGETTISLPSNVQSTNGSGVYVKLGAPGTTFTVNMTHLSQNGTALGVATLSGINLVRATNLADTLVGGSEDIMETFLGRGGNDYIDGGSGNDRSRYDNATTGITANLAAGSVVGDASVGIDTLRSIERIRGTEFDDIYDARGFSGSSLNAGSLGDFNSFEGLGGNDTIYGNGSTLLDYGNTRIAIEANLASGVARARLETERTGELAQVIGQDTFSGVSAVRGSALADLLIGGGLGRLEGGNRVESFEPGGGNDTVNGADGFDSVTYLGNRANYLVTIGSTNVTVTDIVGYEGTDTLTGIEQLVFADLTVSLTTAPPADTTAPTLTSSTPADNASGVLAGTNLALTFSEAIKAGSGNLVLTNTANAADTRTVSVSDASQVSISGSTLTLNPTADLMGGAHYALTLGSGVVQDLAGNSFAGISSATTLDFSVAASTVKPTLSGLAYDWKNHMLLQDVAVSVKGGGAPAEGANAPIQFKALSWDASGHASVEVWTRSTSAAESLGFDLNISNATGITFSAGTLPNTSTGGTGWTLITNTLGTNLNVGGFANDPSAAIAAGDFKLGTITFETATAQRADLQLVSGDLGSNTASAYGLSLARTSSSATGAFSISTLDPGSYDMTASRATTDIGNAITSADALSALKIAVGLNPNPDPDGTGPMSAPMLSPYQFMAADVVGTDGRVTSADALAILKMAVKLPTAPAKEWMFVEETRDFWNETAGQFTLNRNNTTWDHSISTTMQAGTTTGTVNLVGVLKGDVNGSWAAPAGSTDLDAIDPTHFTALSSIFGMPVGQFGVV